LTARIAEAFIDRIFSAALPGADIYLIWRASSQADRQVQQKKPARTRPDRLS